MEQYNDLERAEGQVNRPILLGNENAVSALGDKPRMLALHGWRSNSRVTQKQIENIGLDQLYDVTYLDACCTSRCAATELLQSLVEGPWFSWWDKEDWESNEDHPLSSKDEAVIMNALRFLVDQIKSLGPFEAVYGFSQGAGMACMLCNPVVLANLVGQETRLFNQLYVACAAGYSALTAIAPQFADSNRARASSIEVPSFHLIGVEDIRFKDQSELWLETFRPSERLNLYLPQGHEVPDVRDQVHMDLRNFYESNFRTSELHPESVTLPNKTTRSSKTSRWAFVFSRKRRRHNAHGCEKQEAAPVPVACALEALHDTDAKLIKHSDDNQLRFNPSRGLSIIESINTGPDFNVTIQEALSRHNPNSLCIIDSDPKRKPLTYSNILEFIKGPGDLRLYGVHDTKSVVAYPVPPGAAGAIAILTIASQCNAAPFDMAATEEDVADGIDQFGVTHMMYFEGYEAPGFMSAAKAAGIVPIKVQLDDTRSGAWSDKSKKGLADGGHLINQASSIGLFLRTSGTTSKPKVVPVTVGQLVQNGHALGTSLGIGHKDVCVNVMPLFHIGGISGSIMAVISTGGATIFAPPFKPEVFVQLLDHPTVKPTWYSSVPTIHMAAYNYAKTLGTMPKNSLRFIRSGAAALSHEDACHLRDFWGVPIIPTYSMSELMPISQPEQGYLLERPNSVGQPTIATMAIVDNNLRPVSFGVSGEICISGPTVMTGYLNNRDANLKTFFVLGDKKYMRTGDIGKLDEFGYLTLTGRAKELIKRGGEQVSPIEVEAILDEMPEVQKAIVFSVPSAMWGEEVGCAYQLHDGPPKDKEAEKAFVTRMKAFCKENGVAGFKVPAYNVFPSQLPMTQTKKYIRVGLHKILGVEANTGVDQTKPLQYSDAISGLRFAMSLAVTINHFGGESFQSPDGLRGIGIVSNMRSDWPVSVLIVLGGFSLAAATRKPIANKFDFMKNKLAALHPNYLLALLISMVHVFLVCRPDNMTAFSWKGLASHSTGCAATPIEMPWIVTVFTSFFTYALGLQAWIWPVAWFVMFYCWFNSVYYFCLFCYPFFHNFMHSRRKEHGLWIAMGLMIFFTELRTFGLLSYALDAVRSAGDGFANGYLLSAYFFPPLWVPLFLGGGLCAWIFERVNGREQFKSSRLPGVFCDLLTLLFLARFVIDICGGIGQPHLVDYYDNAAVPDFFRQHGALSRRCWVALLSSSYMPLVFAWTVFMAAGRGWTAHILSNETIVTVFAPAAYNEYLFHQIVGQWYYWVTRGHPWSWWSFRKTFYWFSPNPLPVSWPETLLCIALTVGVSKLVSKYLDTRLTQLWMKAISRLTGTKTDENVTAAELVTGVLEDITGSDVDLEATLAEAGLASIGIPMVVGMINEAHPKVALTMKEVSDCATVQDLVNCVSTFLDVIDAGMENEPPSNRLTSRRYTTKKASELIEVSESLTEQTPRRRATSRRVFTTKLVRDSSRAKTT